LNHLLPGCKGWLRKGRKSLCGAFFLLTSRGSYKELCATAVGQGNIDVLSVAGPFGLVAPVNGAGFDRSLGHRLSSINFIVWMQPCCTGLRGFCVCAPSPATVSLSLATRERPRCRGCAKKRQSQSPLAWPFLSMLISGYGNVDTQQLRTSHVEGAYL
jgi:hypothetical protein